MAVPRRRVGAIAGWAALSALVQAMRGIFGVALYRFAAEGEVASGFTQADLESAVRTRGSRSTAPTTV